MEEIRKQLGKKIREAREGKGLTQKELGKAINYSSMAISHFERGIRELKLSDLQKLSKILEKELAYFLPSRVAFFRTQPSNNPEIAKSLKNFDEFLDQWKQK